MDHPWTKLAALERYRSNVRLRDVISIEPRIQPLLESAAVQENEPGYHRIHTYDSLKTAACSLVGVTAENPQLRTSAAYDLVVGAIADLLPPDDVDLYPDGKPEEGEDD